jgi:hypothetical protein
VNVTRSDAWWQGTTFFFECETSGVPRAWAATDERAGVDLVNNLSPASADHVIERAQRVRRTSSSRRFTR